MGKYLLKRLLAADQIPLFFTELNDLLSILEENSKHEDIRRFSNEAHLHSHNFYRLQRQKRLGLVSTDLHDSSLNRIVHRLLRLLDDMEDLGFFQFAANSPTHVYTSATDRQQQPIPIGLQIESGYEKGRIYDLGSMFQQKTILKGGRFTVATVKQNDINLVENNPDNSFLISRRHFTLVYDEQSPPEHAITIYDGHLLNEHDFRSIKRSTNGVWINEVKLVEATINIDDDIRVGQVRLKVIEL